MGFLPRRSLTLGRWQHCWRGIAAWTLLDGFAAMQLAIAMRGAGEASAWAVFCTGALASAACTAVVYLLTRRRLTGPQFLGAEAVGGAPRTLLLALPVWSFPVYAVPLICIMAAALRVRAHMIVGSVRSAG